MNRYLTLISAGCLLLSSCTLTGDPTKGGIFWSPSKAQARQDAFKLELDACSSSLAEQNNAASTLAARRSKLAAEVRKVNQDLKKMQNQGSDAETQELLRKKAELESQLRILR